MSELIAGSVYVDKEELWSAIFGSAYETHHWWRGEKFADGADWDTIGDVTLTAYDPDDESKTITKSFKPDDIFAAWQQSVANGNGHCGCPMTDIDSADACFGDVVLQTAVYGKIIYG